MAKKAAVFFLVFAAALAGHHLFSASRESEATAWDAPLRYEIWVELDDASKTLHGREEIM